MDIEQLYDDNLWKLPNDMTMFDGSRTKDFFTETLDYIYVSVILIK